MTNQRKAAHQTDNYSNKEIQANTGFNYRISSKNIKNSNHIKFIITIN
jgi:hypothetical protein